MKIPFNKPHIAGNEIRHLADVVDNRRLAGDGDYTRKCETWLESNLRCRRALLTHSGTAALEIAAILCDVSAGDEIITPSFSFPSVANAFVLRGGIPVFVDIRPETLNIDEDLIEAAITRKTKAIVPIHYAGFGCDMAKITSIADEHSLVVVEDAAQAFLSQHDGHYLGTMGHLGCISFHETKNVTSGEGGALLINDESYSQRAEIIREKGTDRRAFMENKVDKYTWVDVGSSYVPNELTAAFLYGQFQNAATATDERIDCWKYYYEKLSPLEARGVVSLSKARQTGNGHIFYLVLHSPTERDALLSYLRDQGVMATFHFLPLHASAAGRRYGRCHGSLQVTEHVSECLIRLPLYSGMTVDEMDYVIRHTVDFFDDESADAKHAGLSAD